MRNILILLALLITGCAQTKRIQEVDDRVFLEIGGDLNEYPELLWINKDIYSRALYRMQKLVKVNKNIFEWDFTAEDVRVSQNLYDYITGTWKSFNEQLMDGNKEIYKNEMGVYFVRFKKTEESK